MRMFLQIAIYTVLLVNSEPLLFAQETDAASGKEKQAAEPIRRRRMTPEQAEAEKTFIAAQAAYNSGDYAEGLKQFKAANMAFESPRFQNLWAWALATCPDEKLRSPLAVAIADKACEKTDYKDARYLDTLAAAYAQMKDFDSAVKWQTKAVELAPDSKKFAKAELSSVEYRLRLYKRKIPYREVPQGAILAKYKDIVGAKLSGASLRQLDDADKKKLIDYLVTVPELRYMATGSTMVEEYYDVLLLMLVSDSMGHQERYDFTQLLPQWSRSSPEKLDKFRKVLIDEREQLDTIDEQFQSRWNKKPSSE
jgi:tetratricopeptide (TPR) repeat protein